jgi:hypothetical protein
MTKTVKILAAVFAISISSGFITSANADMMKKDHMMMMKHHCHMHKHCHVMHHGMMMKHPMMKKY